MSTDRATRDPQVAATLDPTMGTGSHAAKRETRRLTADLPIPDSDLLADTARLTGFNKLTTLVRAIRVLADLERVVRDGGEVILHEADGSRSRLLLR